MSDKAFYDRMTEEELESVLCADLEAEEAAKRREEAKEKLASGEAEIAPSETVEDATIVELTYEPEEGTIIADDIIEDFDPIPKKHRIELQDISEIDIDIDPTSALKKYERKAKETSRHDERQKQKNPSPTIIRQRSWWRSLET